jgi:hypothetical protein
VANFSGAENISNEQLLLTPCEILVPAALERQITADNAAKIQCRILAEGANGPTPPEADLILDQREEVFIIPDILCNAGGVIVSYFEWVQDLQSFFGRRRRNGQTFPHHGRRIHPDAGAEPQRKDVDAGGGFEPWNQTRSRSQKDSRTFPVICIYRALSLFGILSGAVFGDFDAAFGEIRAALAIEEAHQEFEFFIGAFWIGGVFVEANF